MTFPLVPAKSQFDGGDHQNGNCTCASCARLMRYGTGVNVSGSDIRAHQSDQIGGTSIPDVLRATHGGWSFEPHWAAPDDSNGGRDGRPANKDAGYITPTKLQALLADGYMVMLQGDYGDLPYEFRLQKNFRDDHCFTLDGFNVEHQKYYAVDTLFHEPSSYNGEWIPLVAIHSYAYGLAGLGKMFAAWARPPQWHVQRPPGSRTYVYTLDANGIAGRKRDVTEHGYGADCTPPKVYDWPGGPVPTKSLVTLTEGTRKGYHIESRFAEPQL